MTPTMTRHAAADGANRYTRDGDGAELGTIEPMIGRAQNGERWRLRLSVSLWTNPPKPLWHSWEAAEYALLSAMIETGAAEEAAQALVNEVTYGNPDQGTSIHLQRFRSGQVRAEVYVDLACADVIVRDSLDEVKAELKALPCDQDFDGPSAEHPRAVALAAQWDGNDPTTIAYCMVSVAETESDWFEPGEIPPAPADRFITFDSLSV